MRKRKGRKKLLALGAHPGPVQCVSAARCGFHKRRDRAPGARFGDPPPRPQRRVNSSLPQLSDVGGEGGRTHGRAGGQSAELGSRRGGPAAPAAAHSLQTAPALGQRGAPRLQQQHPPRLRRGEPSFPRPDPNPHGSAARLGGRAGGSSQVKLLLSPCEAWSSWKMPSRDGRSRRRLQPPRRCAPTLSLSLGETNLLSGSQLSNLPIMILA